jgi:hypothetical protein
MLGIEYNERDCKSHLKIVVWMGKVTITTSLVVSLAQGCQRRESYRWCDGGVAGSLRHPVARNVVKPNFYLPRSGFADGVCPFNAKDLNFPPTIAWIIVVQNLSRFEHYTPLPVGIVNTLGQRNPKIEQTYSDWIWKSDLDKRTLWRVGVSEHFVRPCGT